MYLLNFVIEIFQRSKFSYCSKVARKLYQNSEFKTMKLPQILAFYWRLISKWKKFGFSKLCANLSVIFYDQVFSSVFEKKINAEDQDKWPKFCLFCIVCSRLLWPVLWYLDSSRWVFLFLVSTKSYKLPLNVSFP